MKISRKIIPSNKISTAVRIQTFETLLKMVEEGLEVNINEIKTLTFEITARGVRTASILEPQKYLKTEEDKKFIEKFDLFGCRKIETVVHFVPGLMEISHLVVKEYY